MLTHEIIIHGKTPFFKVYDCGDITMINLLNVTKISNTNFGRTLFLDDLKLETTHEKMQQIMDAIAKCTAWR